MWFRRRRRRHQPPPVLLPSLDRLAELVERVVALLDQVSLAPEREPIPEPREEIVFQKHNLTPTPAPAPEGWVAFVHSPNGYRLVVHDGPPPLCGASLQLDGEAFLVLRLGPSPLPGDRRRCAFLEREEPPGPARSFDG